MKLFDIIPPLAMVLIEAPLLLLLVYFYYSYDRVLNENKKLVDINSQHVSLNLKQMLLTKKCLKQLKSIQYHLGVRDDK